VVHSTDRLARNRDDLRSVVQRLAGKGVRVEFVKEGLVFTGEDSPMATLMLSVMGAFAEFERSLIRERQREGIALAREYALSREAVYQYLRRDRSQAMTGGVEDSSLQA
jgi:DNA invertase Pin-like site-specific DNA recombinase